MPDPDRNPGGTWEPPPPPPRRIMAMAPIGFSLAALIALLLGYCDIGAILAAIAFVLGFSNVVQARSSTGDPDQPPGGTREIPPPTAAYRPPPPANLFAAASAFNAGAVVAVLVQRCDLATLAVVIAVLLGLLSLFGFGRGKR